MQTLDACFHNIAAADQDWFCKAIINDDLHGPENAFLLTFAIDNSLGVGFGAGKQRAHRHAGAVRIRL